MLQTQARIDAETIVEQVHDLVHRANLTHGVGLRMIAMTAYQLGVEVGMRAGVADVASCRPWIAHFDGTVQRGEAEAIAGANQRAGMLLAAAESLMRREGR